MAKAVKRIPKTLDDAARFLTEERGYEKNFPEICWAIWEQISNRRIKLERHWKKYLNLEGTKWEETSEVVNLSHLRSNFCALEFDRSGYLRFVPEWGAGRYTIVEPCDFREIWPLPASLPEDKADRSASEKQKETLETRLISFMKEIRLEKGLLPREARKKVKKPFAEKHRGGDEPSDSTINLAYKNYKNAK
jgi:hypothetical protein